MSKLFDEIGRRIPLKTRLETTIQVHFISEFGGELLMPLDEKGDPLPEVVEANLKCLEMAKPLIQMILKDVDEWDKDGRPE